MNKRLIMAAAAVAMLASTTAQTNQPNADGYLMRAQAMMLDDNYIGCLDQVRHALALPMDPTQAIQAQLLQALATVHTDKADAIHLLTAFIDQYPGNEYIAQAQMALADCYYGNDYSKALDLYMQVDAAKLANADRNTLDYRKGYCLMKLGNYSSAYLIMEKLSANTAYSSQAKFYCGYLRYAQGKYKEALPLLEQTRSNTAPGNLADYYIGQIYYLEGDYDNAFSTIRKVLQLQGIDKAYQAEANRIAGESAFHLGKTEQALKYLRTYVKMTDAPQPSALYILGLNAYEHGDYAEAVKLLTPATELGDAMSQSAYLYIGQALLKEGDINSAVLAFDKAVNMPFDMEVQETAYYNYAVASLQGGRVPFGNSVNTFESFIKKYPNSPYAPKAQEYIVTAYLNNKNYEQALKSINSMASPTDATQAAKQKVLYMLGAQALNSGNAATAIDYLRQAMQYGRYDRAINQESSLLLGEAYYRNHQYDEAIKQLNNYLRNQNDMAANKAIAWYDLGYAYFAQKKYTDAANSLRKMLVNPSGMSAATQADAFNRLGDCYYYKHDFADAAEAYDRAYELNQEVGDYPLFQKAMMEGYQRNHQIKIDLMKELELKFPSSALIPEALLETTESYIQLNNNGGAINVYQDLVQRFPNTAQGRQGSLQMALTMLNDGQKTNAIQAYKNVVLRYPSSDEATQAADALKRIYADDGRLNEYITFINNVPNGPRMDVNEADALTFDSAEKAYITTGQTDRLVSYLSDYPQGSSRAKALSYLMEGADQTDNTEKAYEYACLIVQDYPDNALALPALQLKAEIEYDQGKGTLAQRTWQELEEKASNATMLNAARLGIARCAMENMETSTALNACDALLKSSSLDSEDRIEALFIKGWALAEMGDIQGARQAWVEAANDTNNYSGMASAFNLAQSYFDQGMLEEAEKHAKAVTDADTPYSYWVARGFILLSDIYAKQGNEFKSQQYLKSLQENYPGTETDIFTMIQQRLK